MQQQQAEEKGNNHLCKKDDHQPEILVLIPTPKGVSDETAAAISLVGVTAHLGLVRDAKLQPGETLFVNGGSGGVGSTVVQMAKAVGEGCVAGIGAATYAKKIARKSLLLF